MTHLLSLEDFAATFTKYLPWAYAKMGKEPWEWIVGLLNRKKSILSGGGFQVGFTRACVSGVRVCAALS